jgi:hypothetical protein
MNRVVEGRVYDHFIPDPGRAEFEGAEALIHVTADIARRAAGEVDRIRSNARARTSAVSRPRASTAGRPVRRVRSGPFATPAGAAFMYYWFRHVREHP